MSSDEVAGLEDEREAAKPQVQYVSRSLRALIKHGLDKVWRRRSVTITEYDPSYKVAYLGNVLTGWAKGEGCAEKPVGTLWRNYCASTRADVAMTVTITAGGLRAVTHEHGLTEYWSHRITFCAAPPDFPRVFCWVYRHEGRRLKQELRCHAVLCSKASVARNMATQLQTRLSEALREFRRDKIGRQQARLSLANALYAQPTLPRRRILLSTGAANYRPPLERSKSAPKLGAIDEISEEESVLMEEEDGAPKEDGSLSSESGVIVATTMQTSKEEEPEPCDVCEIPSALPTVSLEDSDESGYDEEGLILINGRGSSTPHIERVSSLKRTGSRKLNNQVSFSDEVSESSNDGTILMTPLIPSFADEFCDISLHDEDSLSDNSIVNDTITCEYVPSTKHSPSKRSFLCATSQVTNDVSNESCKNSTKDAITSIPTSQINDRIIDLTSRTSKGYTKKCPAPAPPVLLSSTASLSPKESDVVSQLSLIGATEDCTYVEV